LAQHVFDLLDDAVEIRTEAVQLVDEDDRATSDSLA
jgi:hypothetical protein